MAAKCKQPSRIIESGDRASGGSSRSESGRVRIASTKKEAGMKTVAAVSVVAMIGLFAACAQSTSENWRVYFVQGVPPISNLPSFGNDTWCKVVDYVINKPDVDPARKQEYVDVGHVIKCPSVAMMPGTPPKPPQKR
jgi:hypothetical protein